MTEDTSPDNLRKFLESDDPALVRMGISMAKGMDMEVSVKDLEHFLKSEDVETIKTGIMLADEAGIGDKAMEEVLPTILGLYMWDDDKSVRAAAKSVFNKYAPAEMQEKVKKNWKSSYRTLSISGDKFPRIIRLLLELFKSQDDFVKLAVPLIKALRDKDTTVRQNAAQTLGIIGDKRTTEPLIKALEDESRRVRFSAAGALDKLGWVPEIDGQRAAYLIAVEDWELLVEWGEPAIEPLIKALGDVWTIFPKAQMADQRRSDSSYRVSKAIEDKWVRQNAARALGEIGDVRAVEPLIKVLGKGDVRDAAKEALKKLGHEDFLDHNSME